MECTGQGPGAARRCDTGSSVCVQCLETMDCMGSFTGSACNTSTHRCVQCLDNTTCPMQTPYCETTASRCVACLTDGNCGDSGRTCNNGACTMPGAGGDGGMGLQCPTMQPMVGTYCPSIGQTCEFGQTTCTCDMTNRVACQ